MSDTPEFSIVEIESPPIVQIIEIGFLGGPKGDAGPPGPEGPEGPEGPPGEASGVSDEILEVMPKAAELPVILGQLAIPKLWNAGDYTAEVFVNRSAIAMFPSIAVGDTLIAFMFSDSSNYANVSGGMVEVGSAISWGSGGYIRCLSRTYTNSSQLTDVIRLDSIWSSSGEIFFLHVRGTASPLIYDFVREDSVVGSSAVSSVAQGPYGGFNVVAVLDVTADVTANSGWTRIHNYNTHHFAVLTSGAFTFGETGPLDPTTGDGAFQDRWMLSLSAAPGETLVPAAAQSSVDALQAVDLATDARLDALEGGVTTVAAASVTVADAGGRYISGNVEGALTEIATVIPTVPTLPTVLGQVSVAKAWNSGDGSSDWFINRTAIGMFPTIQVGDSIVIFVYGDSSNWTNNATGFSEVGTNIPWGSGYLRCLSRTYTSAGQLSNSIRLDTIWSASGETVVLHIRGAATVINDYTREDSVTGSSAIASVAQGSLGGIGIAAVLDSANDVTAGAGWTRIKQNTTYHFAVLTSGYYGPGETGALDPTGGDGATQDRWLLAVNATPGSNFAPLAPQTATDSAATKIAALETLVADVATSLDRNDQTGTAYTTVLSDAGKVIRATNAAMVTITIPPASSVAYAADTIMSVYAGGAAGVTIAAGAGVTIRNNGSPLTQYQEVTLRKDGTDEWIRVG